MSATFSAKSSDEGLPGSVEVPGRSVVYVCMFESGVCQIWLVNGDLLTIRPADDRELEEFYNGLGEWLRDDPESYDFEVTCAKILITRDEG